MKALTQSYQFIQNISVDVVIGATAMAYLFSKITATELPWVVYVVLGICVWLIYTFDHLLDARKISKAATTRRHRFHQLYFDVLIIAWILLFAVGMLISIFLLPKVIWYWGSFIVIFSVLHLVLVHFFGSIKSKLVLKEVGVAWSYSAGIVVGPFGLADSVEVIDVVSFTLLFFVVLFNLIMFSYFDYYKDQKNEQSSIAINFGVEVTTILLFVLFGIITLFTTYALFVIDVSNIYYYFGVSFLFLVGLFYLLMVLLVDHRSNSETYRKVGDIVFLLPLVLLLF